MSDSTWSGVLHVVAAALIDERGRVLLARRHDHLHQGGLWEFPGGKLEAGEAVPAALARELREEIGVEPAAARPLIRVSHRYPEGTVLLDVWRVNQWQGVPHGRESQVIEWVALSDLHRRSFPAADAPVITALRLPPRYLITPEPEGDTTRFLDNLQHSLEAGVHLVQLRAKSCGRTAYAELARAAASLCSEFGAKLLLNAESEQVSELGAQGVHLDSRRLHTLSERPLGPEYWVGASCHGPHDLQQARAIGADFAVLSPVRPTASHPGAAAMGWACFAKWAEDASLPVYALGGMEVADMDSAWNHGAQGIAAIRGLWGEVE